MLLQRLDDLGVDGTPFVGGFLLQFFMNRLRQPKIKTDCGLGEFALPHDAVILLL